MKTNLTLLLITTGFLTACSQHNWYQGTQAAQTTNCMKQPLAEYKDCNQQSQEMSYQEYEKKREQLQNQDNN